MSTEVATATACADCGEPVTFDRRKRIWRHDRTESNVCAPLCTTAGCMSRAVAKLGYHGFDGAGSRFIRTGWACAAHRPTGGEEYVR